jgi:hypothetical protein
VSLPWDDVADVGVVALGLEDVAAPALGQPSLVGGQLVDVGVAGELEGLDLAPQPFEGVDDLLEVGVLVELGSLPR